MEETFSARAQGFEIALELRGQSGIISDWRKKTLLGEVSRVPLLIFETLGKMIVRREISWDSDEHS